MDATALPPPPVDPDLAARRRLRRTKAFATGLLVLMGAVMLGTFALPGAWWAELLQACAKAGLVGGLADWFAVTALFRRPLGLPIPHTAIIPTQKARLGEALGRFMVRHVFTGSDVARVLGQMDLPGIARRFLADPAATRPAAAALAGLLPRVLASIEDGRARRFLARVVPRMLGGPGAGRVIGRALAKLVEGGRHQDVFTFILDQLRTLLASREQAIALAIEERVRATGGRLVGWALGAQVARRVLALISAELDKTSPDGSEMRAAFDEWMRREIARIETEPERAAELGRSVRSVLTHPTLQAWLWDVWSRLRLALEADAGRQDGRVQHVLEAALANLGTVLEADPGARARLQHAAEAVVRTVLPTAQTHLAGFIAEVVAGWDSATIVDRLELRVGRDLQFVRVNGTLVGFLAGGVVWAVLRATFGIAGY